MPEPSLLRRAALAAATVATVAALQVSLVAGPAQAAGHDPHRDRSSAGIALSTSKVKAGRTVHITGRLTADGHALARTVVSVQKRVHGTKKWVTLKKQRTSTTGRIALETFPLRRSHDFRLAYAGGAHAAPVASRTLSVAVSAAKRTAPAEVQDRRDRSRASIAVSTSKVKAGRTVRITGRLTADGRALARTVVTVQKRVHGTTKWATLKKQRTSTTGRIALQSSDLRRSHDFRLAYAGDGDVAPTSSALVSVTALQKVAITSVSDLHPTAGDVVTISGAAYPGIPDRRAYLQLATSSGWKSVASTRVPTDGQYTVTVRSMRGGEQQYRFLVVGDEGVLPASSSPQTFEVYGWYRLTDLPTLAASSFFGGSQSIAGTVYEDSVSATLAPRTAVYAEYDLGYACRLLRTTFGPTDDSAEDFSARFTAKVDDARPIDRVQPARSAWSETAEISGGQTLRLTSFAVTGTGTAAWGDAEVLCVGRP